MAEALTRALIADAERWEALANFYIDRGAEDTRGVVSGNIELAGDVIDADLSFQLAEVNAILQTAETRADYIAETAVEVARVETQHAYNEALTEFVSRPGKADPGNLSHAAAEDWIKGAAREIGIPEEAVREWVQNRYGSVGMDTSLSPQAIAMPYIRTAAESMIGELGDLLPGMLDQGMGMPFGKGVQIGEGLADQATEVVKPGSPKIRSNLEKAERFVLEELDHSAKKLIGDLERSHSPIDPGASAIAAGTIGATSIGSFVALAAAGSAIETASLGQLEIPGHFFLQIGGMYGLAKMAGSVINVPYHWGVEVGHNYYWAEKFKPMIPSMTDLVRFEVREVWRPEFRKEQLEETPSSEFKRFAGYQGFAADHADSYWAAHWDLPGISQAYEMFHRLRPGRDETGLTFTRGDLLKLMRRRDMLKRYRDPLIAIAYEVPTRREIRMMVDAGTTSRDEAYEMYLDRGVDPRFAGPLADFAWARAQRDPYRARLITAAIDMFKEGIWTEAVFKARLKEENVPESMIEEASDLGALEFERDEWRDFIVLEREKFRKKKTGPGEFLGALTAKGMVPDRAKLLVDRETVRLGLETSQ